MGWNTGSQIIFGVGFLLYYPHYECFDEDLGEWNSCHRRIDICNSDISDYNWRIDYTSDTSYKNFVDRDALNLTCTSKSLMGLFGTMFFVGFALSAGFVP